MSFQVHYLNLIRVPSCACACDNIRSVRENSTDTRGLHPRRSRCRLPIYTFSSFAISSRSYTIICGVSRGWLIGRRHSKIDASMTVNYFPRKDFPRGLRSKSGHGERSREKRCWTTSTRIMTYRFRAQLVETNEKPISVLYLWCVLWVRRRVVPHAIIDVDLVDLSDGRIIIVILSSHCSSWPTPNAAI